MCSSMYIIHTLGVAIWWHKDGLEEQRSFLRSGMEECTQCLEDLCFAIDWCFDRVLVHGLIGWGCRTTRNLTKQGFYFCNNFSFQTHWKSLSSEVTVLNSEYTAVGVRNGFLFANQSRTVGCMYWWKPMQSRGRSTCSQILLFSRLTENGFKCIKTTYQIIERRYRTAVCRMCWVFRVENINFEEVTWWNGAFIRLSSW